MWACTPPGRTPRPCCSSSGLIPFAHRDREAFQEFDIKAWFDTGAKRVMVLDHAERASEIVAEAMFAAMSGRPGPVVVGLPEDIIRQQIDPALHPAIPVAAGGMSTTDAAALAAALAEFLEAALCHRRQRLDPGGGQPAHRMAGTAPHPGRRGMADPGNRLLRFPVLCWSDRLRPPPPHLRPAGGNRPAGVCGDRAGGRDHGRVRLPAGLEQEELPGHRRPLAPRPLRPGLAADPGQAGGLCPRPGGHRPAGEGGVEGVDGRMRGEQERFAALPPAAPASGAGKDGHPDGEPGAEAAGGRHGDVRRGGAHQLGPPLLPHPPLRLHDQRPQRLHGLLGPLGHRGIAGQTRDAGWSPSPGTGSSS